jgi:hypothetical protein
MLHTVEVALEICLGYVAISFLCSGLWFALVFRRERALEAERPPQGGRGSAHTAPKSPH